MEDQTSVCDEESYIPQAKNVPDDMISDFDLDDDVKPDLNQNNNNTSPKTLRILERYMTFYSDVELESEPLVSQTMARVDDRLHHDWVGKPTTAERTLQAPLRAIAAGLHGSVLDVAMESLLPHVKELNHDVLKEYVRVGPVTNMLPDDSRSLHVNDGVKMVRSVPISAEFQDFDTIYFGTDFHVKIQSFEGRMETMKMISDLCRGKSYFVFPDPMGSCSPGNRPRGPCPDFVVERFLPPDVRSVNGYFRARVNGKIVTEPLLEKKAMSEVASKFNLQVLFVRADQFTHPLLSFKEDVSFDRRLLQHYCVGIICPRDTLCNSTPKLPEIVKGDDLTGYKEAVAVKDPIPYFSRGLPLTENAVYNALCGDNYLSLRRGGTPVFYYVHDGAIVASEANLVIAEFKPRHSHYPMFEFQGYGERVTEPEGTYFYVHDVYSICGEANLPFRERWNKFLLMSRGWDGVFPMLAIERYYWVDDPKVLRDFKGMKHGCLIVKGSAPYSKLTEPGGVVKYWPIRILRNDWIYTVVIGEDERSDYDFSRVKWQGEGIYLVDNTKTVFAHPTGRTSIPTEELQRKMMQMAITCETYYALLKVAHSFQRRPLYVKKTERVLDLLLRDPVFYWSWPVAPYYQNLTVVDIKVLEDFRAKMRAELFQRLLQLRIARASPDDAFDALKDAVLDFTAVLNPKVKAVVTSIVPVKLRLKRPHESVSDSE